ncbi:hypothetical protein [Enterococcus sp.]|uniref:hypothetical protein n=1 Tax=Enterococcus sp. TaxID=35783 RepID=UPI00289A1DAE|nr:hypothetical protein [Enterococcus sp.]
MDKFKELYIEVVIHNGDQMTEEMKLLRETILSEEFGDDPEQMDAFIQSIVEENRPKELTELELLKQENKQLQEESEMIQAAFMELSDYIFSK